MDVFSPLSSPMSGTTPKMMQIQKKTTALSSYRNQRKSSTLFSIILVETLYFLLNQYETFDPVIGRSKEIERICGFKSISKNNSLLIGEPGVGKSAIAELTTFHHSEESWPCVLYNKRVVTLDLASLASAPNIVGSLRSA